LINKVGLGRNVDDFDYRKYQNSIEVVQELKQDTEDGSRMYQYIPEREFMDMQKQGFEDNHEELLGENEHLKNYGKIIQSGVNGFIRSISEQIKEMGGDPKIVSIILDERDKMAEILSQRL